MPWVLAELSEDKTIEMSIAAILARLCISQAQAYGLSGRVSSSWADDSWKHFSGSGYAWKQLVLGEKPWWRNPGSSCSVSNGSYQVRVSDGLGYAFKLQ